MAGRSRQMRVMVTTNAATGHFLPLAPTIRELMAAGHDVRVACPASFASTVAAAGFVVIGCQEQPVDLDGASALPPDDADARLAWAVTTSWPSDARPWVEDLVARTALWRPDVVVVEPVEHAGRIAAAVFGIPVVEHGWGFTLPAAMTSTTPRVLADLYSALRATPRPPNLTVDLGAADVQSSDAAPVDRYRYVPWSHPGHALPARDGRSRVLVTLGTYGHPDAARRIRAVVSAARDCGAEVVVALGNPDRGTPADFPADVTVLDWVDMPEAVASCDVVAHHGGAGTSWAALAAGRAALVAPQAGDQFRNARLLAHAQVAQVVDPAKFEPPVLSHAIDRLIRTPRFSEAAQAVAAANADLPDLRQLATDIVEVARRAE
jgi:L-demethylnoviosyl transferase